MGRQRGINQFTGTFGDLSFYHDRLHGYLIRRKGGPTTQQVLHAPAFRRTRENAGEFAAAARAGKLLRSALYTCLDFPREATVTSRLAAQILKIKQLDGINPRGQRAVSEGLQTDEGRKLLLNFDFYRNTPLDRICTYPVSYDQQAEALVLSGLVAENAFAAPVAATHVRLRVATGVFDFDKHESCVIASNPLEVPLDDTRRDWTIACTPFREGNGVRMVFLRVVFLLEANGARYELQESQGLGIVWIDA